MIAPTKSVALTNEEIEVAIRRAVKQRKEAIEQYERGGRADLVEAEREELAILEATDRLADVERRVEAHGVGGGVGGVQTHCAESCRGAQCGGAPAPRGSLLHKHVRHGEDSFWGTGRVSAADAGGALSPPNPNLVGSLLQCRFGRTRPSRMLAAYSAPV